MKYIFVYDRLFRRGVNIGKVLSASNIDLFDKRWTTNLLIFAFL